MVVCSRCGLCCYYSDNKIKCKYLIVLSNKKTFCKIYKNRLYRLIGIHNNKKYFCFMRTEVKKNYKNCPYNKPDLIE